MDFDNLKRKMDADHMDSHQIPGRIEEIQKSKMPIQKVRKSMKSEIVAQLIIILIFFSVPSILEMHPLAQSIYYVTMFVTCLITLGYLTRMIFFLKRSVNLSFDSKDAVIAFIYELRLTLEVYKTAIISGSLLLPLSVFTLFFGVVEITSDEEVFLNLILFNVPITTILLYIFGYIVIAILIYFITVLWSDKLYGVHIKQLEKTMEEFDV